jgi:hypothetical protein
MAYPISGSPWAGSNQNPAYSGIFIPTLWSGKLLEKFYSATVLGAIANTDYEGEIKNYGDTVKVRTRPTIVISDYEVNQDLSVQRPSSDLVELQINKGKYFNVALDDVMEVQSDIDQMSMWAEDASEQFKIAVDTDVLTALATTTDISSQNRGLTAGRISADINLGTTGASRVLTKDDVIDFLVDLGQVLDEQNIPESGRWVIIPAWLSSMIKRSDLKDASLSGDGTSILRNGRLGMIDRFTLYLSNLLPVMGQYADEWPIFFGTNAALSFAAQFTKMETLRSERSFSNLMRGLQIYGYKVLNGVAMGRAIVAKS